MNDKLCKTYENWLSQETNGANFVIAGPCSAETEEQVMATASELAQQGVNFFRAGVWKPRTKPGTFEGVGQVGLQWLKRVKQELGMSVGVEVANKEHVFQALDADMDVLWIGARTSANPFSVQEIADALKGHDVILFIKNPINPDVELWIGAVERIQRAGLKRVGVIHRGFSTNVKSAYRNEPCWGIAMEFRRRMPDIPMLCDPSHMGGDRNFIFPLSRIAVELGYDGFMVESHISPDMAWSDSRQQILPTEIHEVLKLSEQNQRQLGQVELSELRFEIDEIDEELISLIGKRLEISRRIGALKSQANRPIFDALRRVVEIAMLIRW